MQLLEAMKYGDMQHLQRCLGLTGDGEALKVGRPLSSLNGCNLPRHHVNDFGRIVPVTFKLVYHKSRACIRIGFAPREIPAP